MTSTELAVVVLAAGQGTRMKSALPKVLHPLAGVPLIGHALATADALDPDHILVVLRHERDVVEPVVMEHCPDAIVVGQDDTPGTGRAVELALRALPSDFSGEVAVISGDVPLLDAATIEAVVAHHRDVSAAATMLTAHLDDPTGYGRVLRKSDGQVERIVEHADASPQEQLVGEINSGTYVFSLDAVRQALGAITTHNAQGEKYLTDVIGWCVDNGHRVDAVIVEDDWLVEGINDLSQLADVHARLNRMIIRGWQFQGVRIVDPASCWIDLGVEIEPDVTIHPGVQLHGATRIGQGSIIGPDTTLTDCEVGEQATITRTEGVGAVIHHTAQVGPFSYLRPGTVIMAGGKVGTFVETKNSTIGVGAKVPHLSYIGDATIGDGTNIGAGTITANYDGVKKHATVVGKNARTGSHNVFVAPVTIGDGAYTAAGTVVRRHVPPGALAMTVSSQRNLEGWVEQNRPGTSSAEQAKAATARSDNTE
jgi:bifunctional UDP-N-acetylglucosamine pyrophosphorylase / glucosamine-1-phosphate N-acetyltransferase